MSINMDSVGEAEYADHEVQTIGLRIDLGPDEENGGEPANIEFEPVSDRGLDNDELAQLVGFYRQANLKIIEEAEGQQEFIGDTVAEFNFGINLSSRSEFPTDAFTNNASAVNTGGERYYNLDEPGILDHGGMAVSAGQIPGVNAVITDTPAGAGSGSGGQSLERFIDIRDFLGSGPYVDATDDLNLAAEVEHEDVVARSKLEIIYTLYWSVEEMPEGRASFSRP